MNKTDKYPHFFGDKVMEYGEITNNYWYETLSQREKDVLQMRYGELLCIDDVARRYGVTRERIRQIEYKALRRLGKPVPKPIERRHADLILLDDGEIEIREDGKAIYRKAYNPEDNILENLVQAYFEWKRVTEMTKLSDIFIEDLDLSVRSYNCLRRAGILTLNDLTKKTEIDMMKVRNLGRKSMKEVREKLNAMGFDFKEEL